MAYEIEFEDQGQDLLRISCDPSTGEIIDAGPFHRALYANGRHFVDVGQLRTNRMVWFSTAGEDARFFRWPMTRLSLDGHELNSI